MWTTIACNEWRGRQKDGYLFGPDHRRGEAWHATSRLRLLELPAKSSGSGLDIGGWQRQFLGRILQPFGPVLRQGILRHAAEINDLHISFRRHQDIAGRDVVCEDTDRGQLEKQIENRFSVQGQSCQ
jgi:hypothetical protein